MGWGEGMRSAALNKVREYRWELWLFLGLPVVATGFRLAAESVVLSTDLTDNSSIARPLLSIAAWLALLGISYGWVRRSGRDLLGLLWQYLLAVVPLNIVHLLASVWVFGVRSERIGFDEGKIDPVWSWLLWLAWQAMALAVLVWFARRASRDGFDKAVILIGVVAFPGVNLLAGVHERGVGYETGALALNVILSFIAMWALHSVDMGKTVGVKGIWALLGAAITAYGSPYVVQDIRRSFEYGNPIFSSYYVWIYYIAPLAVPYGMTILVAYLIRVRLSKERACTLGARGPSGPA